jgi:hypothetical protein
MVAPTCKDGVHFTDVSDRGRIGGVFYWAESQRATHYAVLKSLRDYNRQLKVQGHLSEGDFEVLIFETFLEDHELAGLLGCVQPNGTIEWVSDYEAKGKIDCNVRGSADCYVSTAICGGDASKLVKYNTWVTYTMRNYARIAVKTLLATLLWLAAALTIYYRGVIYVVYGSPLKDHNINQS